MPWYYAMKDVLHRWPRRMMRRSRRKAVFVLRHRHWQHVAWYPRCDAGFVWATRTLVRSDVAARRELNRRRKENTSRDQS